MEEIKEWLSSGTNYWDGVKLFEEHSSNKVLISQFHKASHDFNYNKLVSCLKEILEKNTPKPPEQPTSKKPSIKDEVPEAVLQMMDQRRMLHTELHHKSSEYERKIGCFKILSLSKKISNYYDGHTEEEEKPIEPLPEDRAQLIAKRNNNRAYISKNKNKESKAAEVKRRIEENNEIEELINGDSEE